MSPKKCVLMEILMPFNNESFYKKILFIFNTTVKGFTKRFFSFLKHIEIIRAFPGDNTGTISQFAIQ